MKIWVSSLSRIHETVTEAAPQRVVSLLSPEDRFPEITNVGADAHHRVHLHDIVDDLQGHVPPSRRHVEGLIAFLDSWSPERPLVVHCWAGISRSTAAALIAACMHNPHTDERFIAQSIRAASPTAFPNRRIVALADDMLGRGGRINEAAASIGPGEFSVEAVPFFIPARF